MLVNHPIATTCDHLSDVIAMDYGNSSEPLKIMDGVYQRGDFSILAARDTSLIDEHPQFSTGHCFGVCDDYMQVFDAIPDLMVSHRQFFITVTPIRSMEEETTGLNWQQWGPYIGDFEISGDPLSSDNGRLPLLVYHVYEVINRNSLH